MQKNLFQKEAAKEEKKKPGCPILPPILCYYCQNGIPATRSYSYQPAINNMGVEIVMQQDEEEEENSNG